MENCGVWEKKILNYLIDSYENSSLFRGENKVAVNIAFPVRKSTLPAYFDESSLAYEQIHAALEVLEEKNWVSLCWKRGKEGHILDKVLLNPECSEDICCYLHREPKGQQVQAVLALVESWQEQELPPVAAAFLDWVKGRLLEGKSVKEYLDMADREQIKLFIKGLVETERNDRDCYLREFSIRCFADSKCYEKMAARIAAVHRRFGYDQAERPQEEILAEYRIYHTPNYVYLKGIVTLEMEGQQIFLGNFREGLGISGQDLDRIRFLPDGSSGRTLRKVVTIENLTTFFRWHEEDGLVIYLGGYHNQVRRQLLKKLYTCYPSAQWCHFGDIDCGGFEIYLHLKRMTGIPFQAYYMDQETLLAHRDYVRPLTANDHKRLPRYMEHEELCQVCQTMLELDGKLEQECVER